MTLCNMAAIPFSVLSATSASPTCPASHLEGGSRGAGGKWLTDGECTKASVDVELRAPAGGGGVPPMVDCVELTNCGAAFVQVWGGAAKGLEEGRKVLVCTSTLRTMAEVHAGVLS